GSRAPSGTPAASLPSMPGRSRAPAWAPSPTSAEPGAAAETIGPPARHVPRILGIPRRPEAHMLCQRCTARDAVARDGVTVTCHLFGEIDGAFCAECLVELQRPYEAALRARISDRAPALTDADLDRKS